MEVKINKKLIEVSILIIISVLSLFILFLLIMYSKSSTDAQEEEPSIEMGAVSLDVVDLELVKEFYKDGLGLEELNSTNHSVYLGYNNRELVVLTENNKLESAPQEEAGLYHLALVFSTRESLANTLDRMFNNYSQFYQGSADHLATEAFYFSDPEGNGVEIYFDKPRVEWSYDSNGKPLMGSLYLDENDYLKKFNKEIFEKFNIKMGHVHLKIGNIIDARKFYIDTLMFEEMYSHVDSLFVARDNYHHHLGMNTWQSAGAKMRVEGLTGLQYFEINYLDKDIFDQAINNIKSSKYKFKELNNNKFEILDPWGTRVIIKSSKHL
jgi:catechol 2,3-dioxygenase